MCKLRLVITKKVILALSEDENKQAIQKLQHLRRSGRLDELGKEAEQQRSLMIQHIVNSRFAQDFKNLDKALFWYLKRKTNLNLSEHALKYLKDLCERMANHRVKDVKNFAQLTETDKAIL